MKKDYPRITIERVGFRDDGRFTIDDIEEEKQRSFKEGEKNGLSRAVEAVKKLNTIFLYFADFEEVEKEYRETLGGGVDAWFKEEAINAIESLN